MYLRFINIIDVIVVILVVVAVVATGLVISMFFFSLSSCASSFHRPSHLELYSQQQAKHIIIMIVQNLIHLHLSLFIVAHSPIQSTHTHTGPIEMCVLCPAYVCIGVNLDVYFVMYMQIGVNKEQNTKENIT